ncbi:MAG TPA: hypothetical protein VJG90_09125 [Candidatus Nanoarchaeia archaeon]|nr:hypothetical protein [Candidatus Nanoarchaeia archaeon]
MANHQKKITGISKSILFLVILAILTWGLASLVYTNWVVQEIKMLEADIRVEKSALGLNTDTDALHFGAVSPGGRSVRVIKIYSEEPSWVTIRLEDELAQWLTAENSSFYLEGKKPEELKFEVRLPREVKEGDYKGKVWIVFRKPWIQWLENG